MVTNRRLVGKEGPDFYPTPSWGTQALLDNHGEHLAGKVWEPACGTGDMSQVLTTHKWFDEVLSTDLYDREYKYQICKYDFLNDDTPFKDIDWVITNPPFNLAEDFLHKSLEISKFGVALLLRTAFLESVKRYNSIWTQTPFYGILTFSQRLSMYPAGQKVKGGGTTSYSWFIWHKGYKSDPKIKWIPPKVKK